MMIIMKQKKKQNICNVSNNNKNKGFPAIKYDVLVCHSFCKMIIKHANSLGLVNILKRYTFKSVICLVKQMLQPDTT